MLLPLLGFILGDLELWLGGLGGAPSLVPIPSAIPGALPTTSLPGFFAGGLKEKETYIMMDRINIITRKS